MDLSDLRRSYEMAARQIILLENQLTDLQVRQHQDGNHDNLSEYEYIAFKIQVTKTVLQMYETYQERKWKELQTESTNQLHEVIHGDRTGISEAGINQDDLDIHMFPAPLSPIRDLERLMPRVPQTSGYGQYHYSQTLFNSTYDDMPESRDL